MLQIKGGTSFFSKVVFSVIVPLLMGLILENNVPVIRKRLTEGLTEGRGKRLSPMGLCSL